ncbi:hypothetical protein P8625_07385 [Tenacibaculum tangerinum]|uniref:Lipoprotein n=1 Tax=Tenacibaculum tangerinum TaxID=3038772 RepID=A0ABY8LAA7_9FLAO|nr:hypothetical protein [Tenacibaculum tangerinum]WGH76955.1 hypothetical protein P8625_07385 [Tenacibaculum tangerinum]
MKKNTQFLVTLGLSALLFASCSSNDTEIINEAPENLLQSYTLKRDSSGAYSIDFHTTDNTDVTTVTNVDNTNEIILAEASHKTATKHSNDFSIENDQLKIGFFEANNGKRTNIYIEDENITFAKGVTEFLNSYSITANEDGTYQLDFTVNDNVSTDFVYNENLDVYEIHLSAGESLQKTFSRHFEVNSDKMLKLDFVNHKYSGRTEEETAERKPRIIQELI